MSKKLLVVAIVCFMVGTGCTSPGARLVPHQNLQAPNAWPKLLAVYMPWFGNRVHMDVGYVSYDPNVLRHQIEQARHMGISGFVVDWYGESQPFSRNRRPTTRAVTMPCLRWTRLTAPILGRKLRIATLI